VEVLVTRPREDVEPLASELAARGHRTWLAPMLTIRVDPKAVPDLSDVQALLFTSANGVRAFAARSVRRDLPALAVGKATAAAARAAGFAEVTSAGGDVETLAEVVAARLTPSRGVLYHAAGQATAGDLRTRLETAGFTVRREMLYAATPATGLPPDVRTALCAGCLDAALFFSPRTAWTFATLIDQGELTAACRPLMAVCLSAAVAGRVGHLPWRAVRTAATPDRTALLDALDGKPVPNVAADNQSVDT